MSKIRKYIKLSEMAKLLSRGAEQFRKEVIKYAIPHIRLGQDRLFDSKEVILFLSSQTRHSEEIETGRKSYARGTSTQFMNSSRPSASPSKTSISTVPEPETGSSKIEKKETSNQKLLSEKQAAEFMGISKMTLLRRRQAKKIKHYRVGFRILYSKEKHIIPFLREREN